MKLIAYLKSLSRFKKRLIFIIADVFGLILTAILAVWLRFGESTFPASEFILAILILPVIALPVFIYYRLYRTVIRYIGQKFAITVLVATSLVMSFWATALFMLDLSYPRSAIIISWILAIFYIGASRLIARYLIVDVWGYGSKNYKSNVLIFGAGSAGKQLYGILEKVPAVKVIGFIDDDNSIHNHEIHSINVYPRDKIQCLIDSKGVKEVFIAIPSITTVARKKIIDWLEPYPVKVSTLPGMDEIVSGKFTFSDIREVNIEDLLGREVVAPKPELLAKCINDKNVMITGAGGSIGSEICRKVLTQKPKVLILYELSELALYSIEQELFKLLGDKHDVRLISILGSVTDEIKLDRVMKLYNVQSVYHAAAYKHVPIVEHNIQEGIINNSFGTFTAAKVAAKNKVQNFVLISTDKAVRPTNFMGASKRLAEMALQALQTEFQDTRFVMVRFGNVLGSSGSVIPLFRKQIAAGGPVTVTHKEITRYFMTIPEAASLVIQAGSMGAGGDVFVLDMGNPVKIVDLAEKVIKLSGLDVIDESGNGDIEIQFTGLRPGEKLYEELLIGDDVGGTEHPRIMKANEAFLSYEELNPFFEKLELSLKKFDYETILSDLTEVVDGFNHTSGIVDYLDAEESRFK